MPTTVAIYLYPMVEVLDFAGPFEVFTTASRVHRRQHPESAEPFRVWTVSRSTDPIRARAGLKVIPDFAMKESPPADILLIPGGVIDAELTDDAVISWVASQACNSKVTASVCTGSFILAKAGLLNGRSATTHWEDVAELQRTFPAVAVRDDVRWVDEGNIVSSAGIAAGIDMSLHLVSRLVSPELAIATARQMDVPYRVDA